MSNATFALEAKAAALQYRRIASEELVASATSIARHESLSGNLVAFVGETWETEKEHVRERLQPYGFVVEFEPIPLTEKYRVRLRWDKA